MQLNARRTALVNRLRLDQETADLLRGWRGWNVGWVPMVEVLLDRIEAEREHAKWRSSIPIRR